MALWAHNSWEPPVGRAGNVLVENDRLMGDIEFAAADIYPFADTIYRLVRGKFIQATSVGFLPKDYEWSNDDEREWGIDFKQQELLEISIVPVPCNANALAEARAKGIDTRPLREWAERTLDDHRSLRGIPKGAIDKMRRWASEPMRAGKGVSSDLEERRRRVKAAQAFQRALEYRIENLDDGESLVIRLEPTDRGSSDIRVATFDRSTEEGRKSIAAGYRLENQ